MTVIGPLPSDELAIHIKMECVLLILKNIYMLIMYGVLYNSLCKFVPQECWLAPLTLCIQSIFIMSFCPSPVLNLYKSLRNELEKAFALHK